MRIKANFIVGILIVLLVACKVVEEIDVIVEQDNVNFSFQRAIEAENGMSAKLIRLAVEKYDLPGDSSSVYWMIESRNGMVFEKEKARLRYGEVLEGMEQIFIAQPLTKGNYLVTGGFTIYNNGKMVRGYEFENTFKID